MGDYNYSHTGLVKMFIGSYGGSGSSYLINIIYKSEAGKRKRIINSNKIVRTNTREFSMSKHTNSPQKQFNYVFDNNLVINEKLLSLISLRNPVDCILSFYRRNKKNKIFFKSHLIHLGVDKDIINNFPKTIEEYADNNEDLFGFKQYIKNWTDTDGYFKNNNNHMVALINYDTLICGENKEYVASWIVSKVSRNPKHLKNMENKLTGFKRRIRPQPNSEVLKKLNELYKEEIEFINTIDSIKFINEF